MEYVLDQGVMPIGIDCPSIGAVENALDAHLTGLNRGAVYVESLTRLDTLPVRGALFVFLPLNLVGGSGAPGRAIAFIPKCDVLGEDEVAINNAQQGDS